MKRLFVLGATVVLAASALSIPALAADGPVKTSSHDVTLGFYCGQVVSYLDFGPVKLRPGNNVAPIWSFTNGAEGQRNFRVARTTRRSGRFAWSPGRTVRTIASSAPQAQSRVRSGRDDQTDADRRPVL